MMKSEEDGELVCMSEEELRRFVQEQVEKDEQLVNRQTQLAQLEEWVKQRERQTAYNRLLYNNACESVLECESVIKGLYGMLGLEYRDTDSEEEGEVKQAKNAIQLAEHSDSADDDGADADDDYVVIDLGASVPEPETEPKNPTKDPAPKTSAVMETSDLKDADLSVGLLPVKKSEETSVPISDPSLKELPAEGGTSGMENPVSVSISKSPPGATAPSVSPPEASSTPPEMAPECPETAHIKTETVELPVDDAAAATSLNEVAPSKSPVHGDTPSNAPVVSSTGDAAAVDKAKSANPKPKRPSPSSNPPGKHTESEKSKVKNGQEGRMTRSKTAPETEPSDATSTDFKQSSATPKEQTKVVNPEESDKSANPSPAAPPPEKGKGVSWKQSDRASGSSASASEKSRSVSSKETDGPSGSNVAKNIRTGSTETSKCADPKPAERPFSVRAAPKATNPEKASLTLNMRTPQQETVATTTDRESKEGALATPSVPSRIQQEIPLKEKMSILGRRRTKTWHQGTILDIRTTDGDPRYKVLFEGGKGKSMLSAHHLACVSPPLLKDLFVGCRVVANYKEENQSWFHAAIIAEMPDRRNRMRFLVFFDDGSASYIALPDLHLVCKPLRNVCDDMEDPDWRKDMQEYLQAYPNPIFVVMRVGQESTVKREDKMEPCVVTQVDASLIQISYVKDQVKEWLYKGSNRIEQIQRIKKRMAEDKKDQSVNKVGWIPNQRNIKPATTTTTSITPATPTAAPAKSSAAPSATQPVPIVTSSSKTSANVSTVTSSTPSKPVSSISTAAASSTGPTVSSAPTVSVPSAGQVVSSASTVTVSSTGQKDAAVSTVTKTSHMAIVNTPMYQPKVILNRVTFPLSDEKTISAASLQHLESTVTSASSGVKRPLSEQEDHSNHAVIPVMETRLKYIPHRCCPACLNQVRPMQKDQHRGKNPLLVPLLYGFRRMTARRRLDGKMSFHVFYRAPCGRSMCEMEEVQGFLFESRCDFLFLDMFSLDPFVLVKRAVLPSSMCSLRYLYLRDITRGKELVPVSCVNEVDSTPPPPLIYTRLRQTAGAVQINTNLDFMVGCDCTDGCRDRSKCACHQLTIEATSLFTDGPVDVSAGYTHKRLPKYVPTGVYECNPLCRCDPWLCGNRLVQHGLQLRLEVFMTQHKGWGIRCLDDIAKGTFVCDFTGKIVTDEMCTGGDASNNEYLANLDYIEGVEKLKEGYESEAFCSDAEMETDKKTLISMTTGALKKHGIFKPDSSSSDEEKELLQRAEMETTKTAVKRKRKADDSDFDDSEFEDDLDDEDYEISMEGSAQLKFTSSDYQRSYTTRRNAKMDSPGEPKASFAKKSTRAFAIKSSHRRVKPLDAVKKSEAETGVVQVRRSTRSLFNEEKGCYLIDAKQEGNLSRYINHSCSPNLFVQNVFVDTHDLRFPWVSFFTSKRIRAGTELTWDYSYEVGSVDGKVLLCCCGSAECTGRLL